MAARGGDLYHPDEERQCLPFEILDKIIYIPFIV